MFTMRMLNHAALSFCLFSSILFLFISEVSGNDVIFVVEIEQHRSNFSNAVEKLEFEGQYTNECSAGSFVSTGVLQITKPSEQLDGNGRFCPSLTVFIRTQDRECPTSYYGPSRL